MNHAEVMRSQSISRLLWTFSLPAVVGMLVNSLYNVVDRIFVGRGIGSVAIAATTVAFPIMIILMAVAVLIGVGATALISIRLGEQKQDEAELIAGNAITMLILLPTILATIFFIFAEPILVAFGASAEVLPYAKDFTQIIMAGAVFGTISMGVNNFIRAEGNPRIAMYTQLFGGTVNVVLNYVAIYILGWGIKGSALATVIAQFISAGWVAYYFFSGRSLIKIRMSNLRVRKPIILSIMSIGFAPFAMQVANSVQQLILNKSLMFYGGDIALAAIGIMFSVATLLFMPIIGISQGAQPIIGFNFGARQFDRVKETWVKAVIVASGISVLGFLIISLWPNQLIGLFSKNEADLTQFTVEAMKVYFLMLPVLGFQIVSANYFQSVGKALKSTILSLSRQVLLLIPLLLILPKFWGIDGIWRAVPLADGLAIIITASMIFYEMKNISGSRSLAPHRT